MAFSARRLATGIASACVAVTAAMACAAGPGAPPVTPADVDRAGTRWPGTGQPELERGRSLFLDRCSSCHVPPSPASIAANDWPSQVQDMKERSKLSDDDAALVERYLVTIASR